MSRTGAVVALSVEARTLGPKSRRADGLFTLRDGTLVAVSGMGGPAARSAAQSLIEAGASALVSWGMAGGLDPALAAGTLCLPGVVLAPGGGSLVTDLHWREILTAAIGPRCRVVAGTLLTSEVALDDPAGKAAAFRGSGAVAVDMESSAIGEVAAARKLPFVVVRAILDTAADALPAVVLGAGAGAEGHVSWPRLVLGLLEAPGDLGAVIRLGQRYRRARQALTLVARTGALAPLAFGTANLSRIA